MSISAVSILTSAVLVYTAAVKPTDDVANYNKGNATELAVVQTPMGSQLPEDLFVAQTELPVTEVEPDDSVIVIKVDSVVDVEEVIKKALESVDMDAVENDIEKALESIKDIDIEIIESDVQEAMEHIKSIDIEVLDDDMTEIKLMMADLKNDSIMSAELSNIAAELAAAGVKISTELNSGNHNARIIMLNKEKEETPKLTKRVFTITNQTTDLDLEEFNRMATAAGMDVRYDCKVWASKVKRLNLRAEINSDDGRQVQDIHIRNVKRNEIFAHNIIWYENEKGQAVHFSKKKECENNHNSCEKH